MEDIKLQGSPAQLLADDDNIEQNTDQSAGQNAEQFPDGPEQFPELQQPEQLSTEQKEERRQLLRKIGRYRAIFAKELTDIQTTGLDTMALEALRDLATDVEFLVGTRRSAKAVRGMFIGGLQGLEVAGPMVGFKLDGLANIAASSEDLLATVDEVAIKYESQIYVDPVARLAMGIAQLALAVDSHNRRKDNAANMPTMQTEQPTLPTRDNNIASEDFNDL
jgi:hypothetical protein